MQGFFGILLGFPVSTFLAPGVDKSLLYSHCYLENRASLIGHARQQKVMPYGVTKLLDTIIDPFK